MSETKTAPNSSDIQNHAETLDSHSQIDHSSPLGILSKDYKCINEIGHGAQANVYLAERKIDHAQVAIKKLNIGSVKTWKEYELFHREADILSALELDGIARFYEAIDDLEADPPCSYIVQEYIQGRTLQEMIQSGSRFSIDRIYEIILQLINLLEALHTHEPPIIHRDIKPSNIILRPRDHAWYQVCLIDFGAVANPQVQGGGSTVAGTFGYMPPEQLTGKPTPASDIYSLGAVAVFLLSGKSPADMPVKDFHLIFEPDMQNMMPAVVETLRQMLEPDSTKRLCDYAVLRERFRNFQQSKFELTAEYNDISQYEDTLKKVSSYCEPGNIELWQRLPDRTPRQIPEDYREIVLQHPEPRRLLPKVSEEQEDIKSENVLLAFPLIYAIIVLGGFSVGFYLFLPKVFFIFLGIIVVPIILVLIVVKLSGRSKMFLDESKEDKERILQKHQNYQEIKNRLFENGRKCIATITQIEYIPHPHTLVENGLVKHYYYRELNQKEIEKVFEYRQGSERTVPTIGIIKIKKIEDIKTYHNENVPIDHMLIRDFDFPTRAYYAIHGLPMFKITYAFNPPDDEKKEDLIHSIVTHVAPEEHYKVGDPLPIIYLIRKDDKGREHVDSMPFPIPLDDVLSLQDVVHAG